MDTLVRVLRAAALWLPAIGLVVANDPWAVGREISGTVVTEDGRPIAGATVVIVRRADDVNESIDRSCYRDCGQHTVTGEDGCFAFHTIHELWRFSLSVEVEGYLRRTASIRPRTPDRIMMLAKGHQRCKVRGRLLLPDGTPVAGTVVRITAMQPFFEDDVEPSYEPDVLTDADGRFMISSPRPLAGVDLIAEVAGTVSPAAFGLRPGARENTLRLQAGAALTGRVLRRLRPADDVVVKAMEVPDAAGDSPPSIAVFPDADGRFTIANLRPKKYFCVYTQMASFGSDNSASIIHVVRAPDAGQTAEMGELNLHPTHTVRGRVITRDGTIPAHSRIVLERLYVDDYQDISLDAAGRFSFSGVPSEPVVLSVRTDGLNYLRGYRISPQSYSLDFH